MQKTLTWKPGNEAPERAPATAVIATRDPEDGVPYLLDCVAVWNGVDWRREVTGAVIDDREFWWMSEADLLAALPFIAADAA